SSTTTDPGNPGPTCSISLEAGQIGAEAVATVTNVPLGAAVRILLDGIEMARGSNSDEQSIVSMPAQSVGDVVLNFDIPDLTPGDYSIVAVGVGFTVTCGAGGLEILAANAATGPGSSGTGGKGGALAFTGAQILGMIV